MAHYMLGEEALARVALQTGADAAADFSGKDEARRRLTVLAIDAATANSAVRRELENHLREQPNDPVALSRLAELQLRDGAMDQTVKTYERVVDGNPQYAPAVRVLALLYG